MGDMLQYILNTIIAVPIVMILIVLSMRLAKTNMSFIENSKYTKVLEKTTLNKDTEIFVLKMGDEGLILASSPSKLETIKNLTKEEVISIEEHIKQSNSIKKENTQKFYENFKEKFKK